MKRHQITAQTTVVKLTPGQSDDLKGADTKYQTLIYVRFQMCLSFNLGGLTLSCPHLSNAADVGVDPQLRVKVGLTNTLLRRKPQSDHEVHRLVVSSRCDVRSRSC